MKKRILYLLAYVFFACLLVYLFRPLYLWSILLVLGPPSIANFLWLKNSRNKILIFSLLTTLFFAPPVELMARLANAWDVQSVLPRILGIAPIENLIFAFFNFFWVLSFYKYFVDKDSNTSGRHRLPLIVGAYCLLALIVFSTYFINPKWVTFNYHSLAFFILLIPGIFIYAKRPKLLQKTWLTTIFFAVIFFIYELVSLAVGSWWWPGEYLWPVILAGRTFPLDDVLIWYFLSTPVLIGGYEFFVDDNK